MYTTDFENLNNQCIFYLNSLYTVQSLITDIYIRESKNAISIFCRFIDIF